MGHNGSFDEGRYELSERRKMDAMDAESEMREREICAEIDEKAEREALADIYAGPVCNAIRTIPMSRWSPEVVKQILLTISAKTIQSDWSEEQAGDLVICTLTDLESDLS